MPSFMTFRMLSRCLLRFRRRELIFDAVGMLRDEGTSLSKVILVMCDR